MTLGLRMEVLEAVDGVLPEAATMTASGSRPRSGMALPHAAWTAETELVNVQFYGRKGYELEQFKMVIVSKSYAPSRKGRLRQWKLTQISLLLSSFVRGLCMIESARYWRANFMLSLSSPAVLHAFARQRQKAKVLGREPGLRSSEERCKAVRKQVESWAC